MNRTQTNRKIIPVFFAVDDNYSNLLVTALESLKDHTNPKYDYQIHILIEELSEKNVALISAMAEKNVTIQFISVTEKLREICSKLHMRDYYTKATYYRFFIPELFPQYDRGLYLDCDIIIMNDVAKMYNCALGSNLVAGIPEEIITDIDVFGRYSEIVLGVPRYDYINAGIIVMNLAEMRKMHIEQVFADMLGKVTYRVAQDQDYLNVICHGRIKYLPGSWNKTPMPYADRSITPNIAHYKINFKPWKFDNVPYGEIFWKYAERTPVYEELLHEKNTYTDAEKKRDEAQYIALEDLARIETEEALKRRKDTVEMFEHGMFEDISNENVKEAFDDLLRDMKDDFVNFKRGEAI